LVEEVGEDEVSSDNIAIDWNFKSNLSGVLDWDEGE